MVNVLGVSPVVESYNPCESCERVAHALQQHGIERDSNPDAMDLQQREAIADIVEEVTADCPGRIAIIQRSSRFYGLLGLIGKTEIVGSICGLDNEEQYVVIDESAHQKEPHY